MGCESNFGGFGSSAINIGSCFGGGDIGGGSSMSTY